MPLNLRYLPLFILVFVFSYNIHELKAQDAKPDNGFMVGLHISEYPFSSISYLLGRLQTGFRIPISENDDGDIEAQISYKFLVLKGARLYVGGGSQFDFDRDLF